MTEEKEQKVLDDVQSEQESFKEPAHSCRYTVIGAEPEVFHLL